jgi:methylamine utilization protein MauE
MGGGMPAVATTAATAVGVVLVAAGAAKLADRRGVEPFLRALGAGDAVSAVARRGLPLAELLAGAWLLSGVAAVAAAVAACVLSAGFAAALLLGVARGVGVPCRCFGVLDRASSPRVALARALLALGGSMTALATTGAAADGGWPARALGGVVAVCTITGFALVAEVAAFRAGVRRVLAAGEKR